MRDNYLTLKDPNGRLLVKVLRSRLYKLRLEVGRPACLHTRMEEDTWRWHARLGHISFKTIRSMATQEMVHGLSEIQEETTMPLATPYRSSHALELLHADLCGPISPSTLEQNLYIFVSIDDCTGYVWLILLKEKGNAFEKFKEFKKLIEKEFNKEIITLRTYRGGEFTSKEFQEFCNNSGIRRHLTAPYTPTTKQSGREEKSHIHGDDKEHSKGYECS